MVQHTDLCNSNSDPFIHINRTQAQKEGPDQLAWTYNCSQVYLMRDAMKNMGTTHKFGKFNIGLMAYIYSRFLNYLLMTILFLLRTQKPEWCTTFIKMHIIAR